VANATKRARFSGVISHGSIAGTVAVGVDEGTNGEGVRLGTRITVDVGIRVGINPVGVAGVSNRTSVVGLNIITALGSTAGPVPQDWSKMLTIISQLSQTTSLDFIYPPNIVTTRVR
jgi:hypothetical protein